MDEPLFFGDEIKLVIPQRAPMLMVDVLYEATDTEAHSGLTVAADNIFCRDGCFTEPGLVEHIAQSASALAGCKAYMQNKPAPTGFIGEVKKCRIYALPSVGATLDTHLQIVSEVNGISLLKACTKVGENVLVECQMKIFVQK